MQMSSSRLQCVAALTQYGTRTEIRIMQDKFKCFVVMWIFGVDAFIVNVRFSDVWKKDFGKRPINYLLF